MPIIEVDGTRLHYEESGAGPALVLVHGGMVQGATWELLVPQLAPQFRVVQYDRRGHGGTGGQPSGDAAVHAADLAALVTVLDIAPVDVVANSGGGVVALRFAIDRPGLVRRLVLHEPALVGLLAASPSDRPVLDSFVASVDAVCALVERDEPEAAARLFVETIVAPGAWDLIPPARRRMMARNAPTVLADRREMQRSFTIAAEEVARLAAPVLLTHGGRSPEVFVLVTQRLVEMLPDVEVRRLPDAGHVPHATHPAEFAAVVARFLGQRQGDHAGTTEPRGPVPA